MADKGFEQYAASDCLTNQIGLANGGLVSSEAIQELVDRRVDVGKRGRVRFGRLICEAEGCEAVCNVEVVEGVPEWRGIDQGFALLGACKVFNELSHSDPEG